MSDALPADLNWLGALASSLFKGLATAAFIALVVYCFIRIMLSILDGLRTSPLAPFCLAILATFRSYAEKFRIAALRNWTRKAMMASHPDIEIRQEIIDPSLVENTKNGAASRAVALIVLLNGIAAIVILASLSQGTFLAQTVMRFADAMMVFSAGAVAGLASALFAYLGRSPNIALTLDGRWRRPLPWLAIAGGIIGTVCFVVGLNMARIAVEPNHLSNTSRPKTDVAPDSTKP